MQLRDYLTALADLWCGHRQLSHARLAMLVVSDGKFFRRLAGGMSPSMMTFERFLRFFRDPANWPHFTIPEDAAAILERLDNIATAAAAESPDNDRKNIGATA